MNVDGPTAPDGSHAPSPSGALSPADELTAAVLDGTPVRRGLGESADRGGSWGEERMLPAAVLYELLGRRRNAKQPRAAVLVGLRITGQLNFEATELVAPLIAHACHFDEPVNLMTSKASELRFTGCHLPGIAADGLETRGDLELSGCTLEVLGLVGARIGGQLLLNETVVTGGHYPVKLGSGSLRPPESPPVGGSYDVALAAELLHVAEGLFARSLSANNKIQLIGARLGWLSLEKASLTEGFNGELLRASEGMWFSDCSIGGEINLRGAQCGGDVNFSQATLSSVDGNPVALNMRDAQIDKSLDLSFARAPDAAVYLNRCRVGQLLDNERTWPAQLSLRGCVYDSVEAREDADGSWVQGGLPVVLQQIIGRRAPADVQRRLRWLRRAERAEGYSPQPYTQLMAVYRLQGRDSDARRVGYERERRRQHTLSVTARVWNGFLRWTVGYGYKPMRAVLVLGLLILFGTPVFSEFHSAGDLYAVKTEHPPFVASIYTVDRLVPVVSFGLRDAFGAHGLAQWWTFAYTILGWALTVAVVAGLNAAARRD